MVDFDGEQLFSDDDSLQRAPNLLEWFDLTIKASAEFGKTFNVAGNHRQRMIDAGFKNVKEDVYKVNFSPSITASIQSMFLLLIIAGPSESLG